ncbi:MAG: hypothetical protein ACI9U2_004588 [Bradymonadia bacterium]|jgi:hypothetical protein
MALLLALASVCSPAQLTEAGRRVQGKGPIEQAWILAQVGCPNLAERRLDTVVAQAQGQYRLHALFTRGRVAVLRCRDGCTPAQRAAGRAALREVEETATAPGQIQVARAMASRLAPPPPPVMGAAPASSAAPLKAPTGSAVRAPAPVTAPPSIAAPSMVAPAPESAPSNTRATLWISAGVMALGAGTTGFLAWRDTQETHRLSAAKNAGDCDGRLQTECRAAWQASFDRARIYTGVSLGLGVLALAFGGVAEWTAGSTSLTAGPDGARIQGVW